MLAAKQYTLSELTSGLDVTIKGNPDCVITGVSPIQQSKLGHLTFLVNSLYKKYLPSTQASAVILTADEAELCPVNAIISRNPYFTYAKIAAYFDTKAQKSVGVHPSAVIGAACDIHASASIGANAVLGHNVKIGANVMIGANTSIGDGTVIGEDSIIDAGVTIYHHIEIGKRTHICAGAVIGADGFGFANQQGTWHKVPQLGAVIIGDDVDIGANTTIDRGAMDHTIIENGVKLDNLIQVAHNVRIGANTIIAGCVSIAGSTTIGKNCMIGGRTAFAGHLSLCDGVIATGNTMITKSINEPGMYSSGIVGAVPNQEFLKNNARFYRLENLMDRVKTLETTIKEMAERK